MRFRLKLKFEFSTKICKTGNDGLNAPVKLALGTTCRPSTFCGSDKPFLSLFSLSGKLGAF
jgi:hypothetical protein